MLVYQFNVLLVSASSPISHLKAQVLQKDLDQCQSSSWSAEAQVESPQLASLETMPQPRTIISSASGQTFQASSSTSELPLAHLSTEPPMPMSTATLPKSTSTGISSKENEIAVAVNGENQAKREKQSDKSGAKRVTSSASERKSNESSSESSSDDSEVEIIAVQVSISSTFYSSLFHTKVFYAVFL